MKCPGQDMQYWTDSAIFEVECPKCNTSVEFYKDDTSRKCGHCGNRFVNPKMDFGCASYCQFAEQCLGSLPEEFQGKRENLLKDKVAVEMKRHYKSDFKSISRAMKIARHAENIGKSEGGNLAAILCAAYLHEIEDSVAASILEKLAANPESIKEVLEIMNQRQNSITPLSLELKVINDAILLHELQDTSPATTKDKNIAADHFFTQSARNIMSEILK
jgi:hypothetical protein